MELLFNRIIFANEACHKETFRIRTKKFVQNAPRDPYKLQQLLKRKGSENEESRHMEGTQWLVTEEMEMFKVVFCL